MEDVEDPKVKEYVKELSKGYHFSGEILFFRTQSFGYGVNVSYFKTGAVLSDMAFFDENDNLIAIGNIEENVSIIYIAPTYSFHSPDMER